MLSYSFHTFLLNNTYWAYLKVEDDNETVLMGRDVRTSEVEQIGFVVGRPGQEFPFL